MRMLPGNRAMKIALLIAFTAILSITYATDGRATVLSDTRMDSLRGGAIYCCDTSTNCECTSNDCSDIECSSCKYWNGYQWVYGYCKGNNGDSDDVTSCYKTSSSSSCTEGSSHSTNCEGSFYRTSGCFSSPTFEDVPMNAEDCS